MSLRQSGRGAEQAREKMAQGNRRAIRPEALWHGPHINVSTFISPFQIQSNYGKVVGGG